MIFFVEIGRKCLYQDSLVFHIEKNCKLRKFNHIFEFLIQELFDSDYDKNYGGPEVQLFPTNHNCFLQITTSFNKPQLFSTIWQLLSTNHNFFLQIAIIFYIFATFCAILKLFSTILQLFSAMHNFFLQITTIFFKPLLLLYNTESFLHIIITSSNKL